MSRHNLRVRVVTALGAFAVPLAGCLDTQTDATPGLPQCYIFPGQEWAAPDTCPCDWADGPRYCFGSRKPWECVPYETGESRWGHWVQEPEDPPWYPIEGEIPRCHELYRYVTSYAEVDYAHTDCCEAYSDWASWGGDVTNGTFDPNQCPCERSDDLYPKGPSSYCSDDGWILGCQALDNYWVPLAPVEETEGSG